MQSVVSLLAGFVAINLAMTASVAAAERWGWGAGVAVAVVLAVVSSFAAIFWKRPSLAWAGVLMLAGGALSAMDAAAGSELTRLPHAEGIAVANAPAHAAAGSFTFTDGVVRAGLQSKVTHRSRNGSRDYWAAPVVGDTWTTDQPVTVWAVCDAYYGCAKDWAQPWRAGVRPTGLVPEEFAQAIADAEASHGLTSAPGALTIRWVASVTAERSKTSESITFGVRVWNITWVVTFVIGAAIAAYRRRRSQPGEEPTNPA